ncbi:MAG: hypothetical protein NTX77_13950 [Actinobacteria bacterium]|nr:hypothetical protein [Actinomycetota bacterium]
MKRIEPALRVSAGHQRCARIVAVSGHGVGPVGHELGIDKALKDLGDEHALCRTAAGTDMDPAIVEPDLGRAIKVRGFFVAKRAVGIGEHFPTAHDQVELVE